jgi:hypothetical protein
MLAPDINGKIYQNRWYSFNACVPSALSMEAVGSLQTWLPVYQTTRHHKPQDWAHHLIYRSLPLHLKSCLIQIISCSASFRFRDQFFYSKLTLPFIAVSILLSRFMESYILFSSLVMVTPVTIPHTCEQSQIPLFSSVHFWSPLLQSSIPVDRLRCCCYLQFTSGHPCYNPPYLWTDSDAVVIFSSLLVTPVTIPHTCGQTQMPLLSSVHFWSRLLQSPIPVISLRYRILPARLRLHFYLLDTWVGRRNIETKPKATRTETWGEVVGLRMMERRTCCCLYQF